MTVATAPLLQSPQPPTPLPVAPLCRAVAAAAEGPIAAAAVASRDDLCCSVP
jgi:hypothetical protein